MRRQLLDVLEVPVLGIISTDSDDLVVSLTLLNKKTKKYLTICATRLRTSFEPLKWQYSAEMAVII